MIPKVKLVVRNWFKSKKKMNQEVHAMTGNTDTSDSDELTPYEMKRYYETNMVHWIEEVLNQLDVSNNMECVDIFKPDEWQGGITQYWIMKYKKMDPISGIDGFMKAMKPQAINYDKLWVEKP